MLPKCRGVTAGPACWPYLPHPLTTGEVASHDDDTAQLDHLLMAHRDFTHPSDQVELSDDSRAQKFGIFWLVGFKHRDFDTNLFILKFAGLVSGIV